MSPNQISIICKSAAISLSDNLCSRLDYCNALISDLPCKVINQLQLIQNSEGERTHYISSNFVSFRIDFQILLLVFKVLCGLVSAYFFDKLAM